MEFESPDVERDFPGLYASESGRKSNESDFSDESHEKISKKDLLIGKRKEKKEKKTAYATLEGESSLDEDNETKSPSKTKKSKPFKFPSKKEKREKSRDKESKESDKDRKKSDEKEKDKKKESKVKLKLNKEKKKEKKSGDEVSEISEDRPIFGVPLSVAVDRSKCHDGVDIPLVVRNCIDHVQETGMFAENVYKVSGIKSRVQQVRRMYNNHEPVKMSHFDLPVATSLLKQFLRELPEPVLTTELTAKFEEAGAIKDAIEQREKLKELINLLPSCNNTLLGWLLVHLDQVTVHEKVNKMNAQAVATVLSPLLQMSQRLLTALLCHVSELYPDIRLTKYIPPLTSVSPGLPETSEGLSLELSKQESLLAQLHKEIAQGLTGQDRVDQLWSVQRTVTHLKRLLRSLEKTSGHRSIEDSEQVLPEEKIEPKKEVKPVMEPIAVDQDKLIKATTLERTVTLEAFADDDFDWTTTLSREQKAATIGSHRGRVPLPADKTDPWLRTASEPEDRVKSHPVRSVVTAESLEVQDINKESTERVESVQRAIFETEELVALMNQLRADCEEERNQVRLVKQKIISLSGIPDTWGLPSISDDDDELQPLNSDQALWARKIDLKKETKLLQEQKKALIESLIAESDACVDLRVRIKTLQSTRN